MLQAQQTIFGRSGSRVQPFTRSTLPARRTVVVRAGPESNGVAATATLPRPNAPFQWNKDTETIRDVFAFAGPAPERVNGRVAMWAFAAMALTEVQTHTPALEQVGQGAVSAVFFSLLITLASLTPKLLSGTSLKDLHESATTANMSGEGWQQILGVFDQSLELWTGRVAMIGLVGLVVAEVIKGDAFF